MIKKRGSPAPLIKNYLLSTNYELPTECMNRYRIKLGGTHNY